MQAVPAVGGAGWLARGLESFNLDGFDGGY